MIKITINQLFHHTEIDENVGSEVSLSGFYIIGTLVIYGLMFFL